MFNVDFGPLTAQNYCFLIEVPHRYYVLDEEILIEMVL